LLRWAEIRRLDQPALHAPAVSARVPDLLDLAEPLTREDVAVHVRQLPDLAGAADVEGDDVARLLRRRARADGQPVLADHVDRQHVCALGHLPDATVE